MRSTSLLRAALLACAGIAAAHSPPLLAPKEVAALANELSGEIAKRNLEGLARFHRQRGSQGLHSAAEDGSGMSRHTPAGPLNEYEQAVAASIETFGSATPAAGEHGKREHLLKQSRGDATTVFHRLPEPKGPLTVFGYDYFASHAKAAGIATPRLLSYQGEWGAGEEYAYEALNFADGTRTAQQIDAELSAEYGPIPTDVVLEYLQALSKIGVVQ